MKQHTRRRALRARHAGDAPHTSWLRRAALVLYVALIALVATWEAWLAPSGVLPRGAWLVFKLAPLGAALYGVWCGGARAHVIAALIALLYFTEGVVLAWGATKGLEAPATLGYALIETGLALGFVVCASLYVRSATARAGMG